MRIKMEYNWRYLKEGMEDYQVSLDGDGEKLGEDGGGGYGSLIRRG
jgi:hypothetical protein